MDRKIYIAYGSNLNLPQMAIRCPGAAVIGKSILKDYELVFRGGRRGAVATVEPKKGSSVPVLLWEISKRDERELDHYEGFPRLYGKQMMDIECEGRQMRAMIYLMTPGYEIGIPLDKYADIIWQGYESAGFDIQILVDAINKSYQAQQETVTEQPTQNFGSWGQIK